MSRDINFTKTDIYYCLLSVHADLIYYGIACYVAIISICHNHGVERKRYFRDEEIEIQGERGRDKVIEREREQEGETDSKG